MVMQSPSSLSSSSFNFNYDVFISFRGTDTRFGFTGNLYKALTDKGIQTFIDDKELQRGDEITPSLLKNIEDSMIAIIVFSENYASSSFCLDELVHIIHCSKKKGSMILPVFYGTEPSHVRHLNDSYGEAMTKHEARFHNNKDNIEKLKKWKMALNQAANLSGYHFNLGNEYEHDFIGKIVKDVSNKMNCVPLHVADYVVGLEPRILAVNKLLNSGSDNKVCIIGIHGIGGMGKTTLARAIYNMIADKFEGLCFLHNVRENSTKYGLEHLQEQLLFKTIGLKIKIGHVCEGTSFIKQRLSQKKVLLILDDIDKMEQLRFLIGGPDWLGPGSKVIITTRDEHLLGSHGVERTYEVFGLDEEEALELLRLKVGINKMVDSSYEYILNRAVTYASGLPLAIEVVGSNLSGKHISEWNFVLDKYKRIPHQDIQKILRVSFDALDEEEQSVFLDIACCLKGYKLVEVEKILHNHYGYCIKSHIGGLVEKSLIKTNYRYGVELHDLIEDMGKEIVRQESPKKPGKRSRLWFCDDIVRVLKENTGTRKIEMIHLNSPLTEAIVDWNGKAFKKMKNLKTLIIENGNFSKGARYFPSSLRILKWNRYPSKLLSSSLSNKKFENMKVLTFNNCQYLTDIPDVSGLPNLEKFSFENCDNLVTIHNSIGYLDKLEILNARRCKKLESFPPLWLISLKELELSSCKSLKSFPELLGKMENIKKIYLDETSIVELPFSFQNLSKLHTLIMFRCGEFRLSSNIFMMQKLLRISAQGVGQFLLKHNDKLSSTMSSNVKRLTLSGNNLTDECLPKILRLCANVIFLSLSSNSLKILPECLNEYCYLMRSLELFGCNSLEEIRGIPPNLQKLFAGDSTSLTSSCRRMLLSQKLHESGCTDFLLPSKVERIPDWFEHQIIGETISFWFHKKIPSIILFYHLEAYILPLPIDDISMSVALFVNGVEGEKLDLPSDFLPFSGFQKMRTDHTRLFDLELEKRMKHKANNWKLDKALLENEWIHVNINFISNSEVKLSCSTKIGIHA